MKTRKHHNNKGYRQIKNGTLKKQIKILNNKLKRGVKMKKEIGTVEPIEGSFIKGAIAKYGANPSCLDSLTTYIEKNLEKNLNASLIIIAEQQKFINNIYSELVKLNLDELEFGQPKYDLIVLRVSIKKFLEESAK